MKQTAVEWLVDEMIQRKFFEKETELSYTTLEHLTNQAKEMEKQQTCSFGAKCCLMTRQQRSWNIEDLYDENF
jgi:hypothetical protein